MTWVYHDTNRYGSMTQAEMEVNVNEIYAQLYFHMYHHILGSI